MRERRRSNEDEDDENRDAQERYYWLLESAGAGDSHYPRCSGLSMKDGQVFDNCARPLQTLATMMRTARTMKPVCRGSYTDRANQRHLYSSMMLAQFTTQPLTLSLFKTMRVQLSSWTVPRQSISSSKSGARTPMLPRARDVHVKETMSCLSMESLQTPLSISISVSLFH